MILPAPLTRGLRHPCTTSAAFGASCPAGNIFGPDTDLTKAIRHFLRPACRSPAPLRIPCSRPTPQQLLPGENRGEAISYSFGTGTSAPEPAPGPSLQCG